MAKKTLPRPKKPAKRATPRRRATAKTAFKDGREYRDDDIVLRHRKPINRVTHDGETLNEYLARETDAKRQILPLTGHLFSIGDHIDAVLCGHNSDYIGDREHRYELLLLSIWSDLNVCADALHQWNESRREAMRDKGEIDTTAEPNTPHFVWVTMKNVAARARSGGRLLHALNDVNAGIAAREAMDERREREAKRNAR